MIVSDPLVELEQEGLDQTGDHFSITEISGQLVERCDIEVRQFTVVRIGLDRFDRDLWRALDGPPDRGRQGRSTTPAWR